MSSMSSSKYRPFELVLSCGLWIARGCAACAGCARDCVVADWPSADVGVRVRSAGRGCMTTSASACTALGSVWTRFEMGCEKRIGGGGTTNVCGEDDTDGGVRSRSASEIGLTLSHIASQRSASSLLRAGASLLEDKARAGSVKAGV